MEEFAGAEQECCPLAAQSRCAVINSLPECLVDRRIDS